MAPIRQSIIGARGEWSAPRAQSPLRRGRLALALTLATGLLLPAQSARAQSGSVSGRVIDQATLRPLPGVQVVVVGASQGALTASDGRFVIGNVAGDQVTVQAVMLG